MRGAARGAPGDRVAPRGPADGQALLRDPAMTYAVNVIGTVNVLEAVRLEAGEIRAVVVVTSDKCYENPGGQRRGSNAAVRRGRSARGQRSVLELEGLRGAGDGGLPQVVLRRRGCGSAAGGRSAWARAGGSSNPNRERACGQRDRWRGLGRGPADRATSCGGSRRASRSSCATPTRCAPGSTC